MKNYILLDGNLIIQAQQTLNASPPWIEVQDDAQELIFSTRHIYVDGVIIDTKQPLLPPERYMDWDSANNVWVSTKTDEIQWGLIRQERDSLLAASDWTDTASAQSRLGDDVYNSWQSYRQQLRDITSQPNPFEVTWPTKPSLKSV